MSTNPTLPTSHSFADRHIGPDVPEEQEMLKELGFSSLDDMAQQVVPQGIRTSAPYRLGLGLSEVESLQTLRTMMGKNQVQKSLIGMGYYGCHTPAVIQRNILENPGWYTAYTPYQAEISQGRMEALVNFQTMVCDLTKMAIANASLLDEGTAAAEAMAMAYNLHKKAPSQKFLVSKHLHPHAIEVLQTRAAPLGLEMVMGEALQWKDDAKYFAVFVQYPNTQGKVEDYRELAQRCKDKSTYLCVGTDLLALTLLTPPGEWGADIVYGTSQRFGVPLGFGGPHAAFFATRDEFKRTMPGRLIGVSIDSRGKPAYRLALQTREQHIRREKATSNICTSQVLLANMASMYAVYHGPVGLKAIASRVHGLTLTFAEGLKRLGFGVRSFEVFDTLRVTTPQASQISEDVQKQGVNLWLVRPDELGISFDETCTIETVTTLWQAFHGGNAAPFLASDVLSQVKSSLPQWAQRTSEYLTHPVFHQHQSETKLMRYIHELQGRDITLTKSMIPLGSCTMKLNAAAELMPVSWPEVNQMHPFAPIAQAKGYLEMIKDLEEKLCDITGFSAVSLQPNSGAQGEYAGLLVIKKYFEAKGEGHRDICLIPSSAHGTNPASASMAGMKVVVVNCDSKGNVEVQDLKAKAETHKAQLAALMVTYPSTHGVFEESIVEICEIIHANGGQVYLDGANLNALVGLCRPAELGADVSHMNLHKTFAIPHGGGGPGVGPIGVREHLKDFLPRHSLVPESGPEKGVSSTTSAPWGSASILPISWSYIAMMGLPGLRKATLMSILSANYVAKKLAPYYSILFTGKEGLVAHECILDLRPLKAATGIDVTDVAKRLMDFGFHSPTMSWPVAGTLMVEPTESEGKAELDRFVQAMIHIHGEITKVGDKSWPAEDNPLRNAPHTAAALLTESWSHPYTREQAAYPLPWVKDNKYWPPVGRVDNVYGDKNIMCTCPPIEAYQN